MSPALEFRDVSVVRGGIEAVSAFSLAVGPGEAVALLGANGAGKSSLLRFAMGLAEGSGAIVLDGARIDALPAHRRARKGLAYAPEGRRVFAGMTVRENLEVAADAPALERGRRLAQVFALFPDLEPIAASGAWRLSGGQQQMLAVGRALMRRPRVLLLDEPSLGLAPRLARDLYRRFAVIKAEGTALLIAEQAPALALGAADRVAVLARGRLVSVSDAKDEDARALAERALFADV